MLNQIININNKHVYNPPLLFLGFHTFLLQYTHTRIYIYMVYIHPFSAYTCILASIINIKHS